MRGTAGTPEQQRRHQGETETCSCTARGGKRCEGRHSRARSRRCRPALIDRELAARDSSLLSNGALTQKTSKEEREKNQFANFSFRHRSRERERERGSHERFSFYLTSSSTAWHASASSRYSPNYLGSSRDKWCVCGKRDNAMTPA